MFAIGGAALLGLGWATEAKKKEGFWGIPARSWKVDKESSYGDAAGGMGFYSIPANYSQDISPRFSNTLGYGPNARTELQNVNPYLPQSPLSRGCPMGTCGGGKGGRENYSPGFADGNFNDVARQLGRATGGTMGDPSLAKQSMAASQHITATGEVIAQPIVYDRMMMSNKQSRLRGLADPIRGDLAITPRPMSGWFSTSVQPNLDLHPGALNVMGGATNESARALDALIRQSSGMGESTLGGIPLKTTPGVPSYELGLSAAQGDVEVRAFP